MWRNLCGVEFLVCVFGCSVGICFQKQALTSNATVIAENGEREREKEGEAFTLCTPGFSSSPSFSSQFPLPPSLSLLLSSSPLSFAESSFFSFGGVSLVSPDDFSPFLSLSLSLSHFQAFSLSLSPPTLPCKVPA